MVIKISVINKIQNQGQYGQMACPGYHVTLSSLETLISTSILYINTHIKLAKPHDLQINMLSL